MARTSVGLDIGTRAVRAVEVRADRHGSVVTRFGRVLAPSGAIEHGEVQNPVLVGDAIQRLWQRLGLSERKVHLGVSNRRVVVRVMELPAMKREDLDGAVRLQAADHVPIPLDEAVMDYQVLEEMEGEDGQQMQRVLVVAAERATIEPLLAAVAAAKLQPVSLELNAYPLVRSLGNGSESAEAILDIGAGITNIVIHQGGNIRFTRILPNVGGDDFTAAVAEGLSVSEDEAEELKRHAAQPETSPGPSMAMAIDPEGLQMSEDVGSVMAPSQEERARALMAPVMDRFTSEVRRSIDFYTKDGSTIDRVVVTGGGSLLAGISDALTVALGVPTEVGHPFGHVSMGELQMSEHQLEVADRYMSVAVGLALAGV